MSRGGKREGSGRKPRSNVRRQFKISRENAEFLDCLQEFGAKSIFVNAALDEAIKKVHRPEGKTLVQLAEEGLL